MTALSHRVGRDGLDEDLLHEIAAILDEAAQRIERRQISPGAPVSRVSRSRRSMTALIDLRATAELILSQSLRLGISQTGCAMSCGATRDRGRRLRARRRSHRRRPARPASRSRRRGRGWSRRSLDAATTGSAQAIASSVTLPNASVIDGLKNTSRAGQRSGKVGRRPAGRRKSRSGRRSSNHARAGPSPMTSTWCRTPRSASTSIASANTSRPFSMHDPAEEGDDQLVVVDPDAPAATPCRAVRD